MKKKRSFANLLSSDATGPSEASTSTTATDATHSNTPGPSRLSNSDDETPSTVVQEEEIEEEDDYGMTDRYVRKNIWVRRNGMQLHPYADDAPYMEAYNPILLEKYVMPLPHT